MFIMTIAVGDDGGQRAHFVEFWVAIGRRVDGSAMTEVKTQNVGDAGQHGQLRQVRTVRNVFMSAPVGLHHQIKRAIA